LVFVAIPVLVFFVAVRFAPVLVVFLARVGIISLLLF
jgi:hypothetical protein